MATVAPAPTLGSVRGERAMIQKKICLLGAPAVGKTSLIKNFVHGIFSDRWLTSMGVHITKKGLSIDGSNVQLVIWDIYGEDEFQEIQTSYLRGASGCLLVADGTRANTLDKAMQLRERVVGIIGDVGFVLALNKADLQHHWQITDRSIASISSQGLSVIHTSAKTGAGVETAFATLARSIVA